MDERRDLTMTAVSQQTHRKPGRCLPVIWIAAAVLLTACSAFRPPQAPPPSEALSSSKSRPYKVMGQWYYPRSDARGFRETGYASWYGKPFHGRKTANGETYDMYRVSAAHKTLPFNTVVRVRNLQNGAELDVRINDRGPFVRGRIIDLSYAAARKIGIVGPGTARVEIVALGMPDPAVSTAESRVYRPVDYRRGPFTFQVGAFQQKDNAEKLRNRLQARYPNAHIVKYDSGQAVYYRVRVGRFQTLEDAREGESRLIAEGFEPFIVAD